MGQVALPDPDDLLVKDETHFDKFDRVFGEIFKGLEAPENSETTDIPEDWLRKLAEKFLNEEDKKDIKTAVPTSSNKEKTKKKKIDITDFF